MTTKIPEGKILVQFDGICCLCSWLIKIIIRADRNKKLIFQSLQETTSNKEFDSIIVYDQNLTYAYFDAILKIGEELGGIYSLVAIFKILPKKWRHSLYRWIAKNRYSWFGVKKTCYLPTAKEKSSFI